MAILNEREKLLKRLQMANFVLADTALYLDTHPKDKMALEYYNKYKKMRKEALMDYTSKYGPISQDDVDTKNDKWTWVDNPWPWENEV